MLVYMLQRPFWLFLFLVFLFGKSELHAQCNPPDQLPTVDCQSAPLVCLLNACYETLNIPGSGPNGFCGNMTSIQNPQYFQVIPTAPNIEIDIHVDFCDSGSSLQCALIDDCPWDVSNVLDCDPGTGPGGTMILTASGLIPGQIYWVMLDGFSGATCNYTITNTTNIFSPGFSEELQTAEAMPNSVCQGYDDLTFVADPPIANAHGYYWVLGWSGDTITSTLPTTMIDVPEDVSPGIYDICVRAFSGCDTTDNDLCFQVEVYEIPPEDKDPEIFCPELFPFPWGSVTVTGPGEYMQTFHTPEGCFYDSIWMVDAYPMPDIGQIDTIYCLPAGQSSFYYEGMAYDQSGTYLLEYPNGDVNGCDSTAELNLTLIGIDALVELTCENGEFVLTSYIQEVVPFNADIDYTWYQSNVIVGDENPLYTLTEGCYDLYAKVIAPEGFCEFFVATYCFDADAYYPPAPVLSNGDTTLCGQAGVNFCVVPDPFGEANLEYVWSAPFNVPVFQDGSECAEMDWSVASGGQVCVYAIGMCGAGEPTCFEVNIIPPPIATFTYDPQVCSGTSSTITFTGSASSNAQFIWDFGNPTNIVGAGAGPYMITWSVPGIKTVSLSVIEPGCDTAMQTVMVDVSTLPPPVINCSSTINSIDFDWDDIPGASQYLVSLNGGQTVPVAQSDTLVTNLMPGAQVELILTVVSGGPCPNIMDTLVCKAEDCLPPPIDIMGEDSACLNNPSIITLTAFVNGLPATGIWSGPGIIDMNMGLFDPAVAMAGQHQIQFSTMVNNCTFNKSYTITVFDSLTADFMLDPVICITDAANLQYTGNASSTANYLYNFGTANVLSGSGEGPYTLGWNTAGQKTVRLQVEENGCMSDIITHTTDVSAALTAPVVPCSPNTSGVVFTWTLDPLATDSMINVLTGQSGVQSGNKYTFNGLNPGDTVRIEIISMSNGPCPDRRDTFECVARTCPMPQIAITPVNSICLYPGISPVNLDVTVMNGNGTGSWSGTGVTDMQNGVFDPLLAGAGSHLITYHYVDDGCDFLETTTIDVFDIPNAFISTTDLIITCQSSSVFLDGSSSAGNNLSYSWTTLNGNVAGSTTGPVAEATTPGTYQLLVFNMVSGCRDSVSVNVTQDANIPICNAGPDKKITCDSVQYLIGNAATSAGVDIIYTWSTADGNIAGPTNGKFATANAPGTYNLVVRDTATGCQAMDNVVITMDTAVAQMALTPGDTIDCNTTVSNVTSMLTEDPSGYSFLWTTPDGLIQGATDGQQINVTQGGMYTLTIHNTRNGCETSSSASVAESDEIIDDVVADEMDITCHGDRNGMITISTIDGGTPPYTYTWSTGSGTMLINLAPGAYGLTVTDINGCTFTDVYTITEPPAVTLDLGPNKTVNAGDSVHIKVITNVPAGALQRLEWVDIDGSSCPGCSSLDFEAMHSGTISAMIEDTSGCTAMDSMRLTVLVPKVFYIPTVFSPNGDYINDRFFISGRFNLISIKSFRIFDRWGNEVFEGNGLKPNNPEDGWDGKFEGKQVQSGVYAYIAELEFEDVTEVVSGNVTVLR